MLNFADIQKRVLTNKLAKGFNTTNIPMEFALAHGELSEAFEAYLKKTGTVGEEIADVMIYLLWLCELLEIDLESELMAKLEKNEKRRYEHDDNGVLHKQEG